jgi:hypothetical protein
MNKTRMTQIFERLRKTKFITDNTNDSQVLQLFDYLNDNERFEAAKMHFDLLGITLEKGEGYFYFSKQEETNTSIEIKIRTFHIWIDRIDFFKTYNHNFGVGTMFEPSDVRTTQRQSVELTQKLERIGDTSKPEIEQIKSLADGFVSKGFAIIMDGTEQYKILSSYRYLEDLITQIEIPEDETVE